MINLYDEIHALVYDVIELRYATDYNTPGNLTECIHDMYPISCDYANLDESDVSVEYLGNGWYRIKP